MACFGRIFRIFKPKTPLIQYARYLNTINAETRPKCVSLLPPTLLSNSNNHWIYQQNDQIQVPVGVGKQIEFPNGLIYVPMIKDPKNTTTQSIEAPSIVNSDIIKQADRKMIVIRRKKMKKHKLKKLRKKMKHLWAKVRQRRELRKEKAFQSVLIAQCKEAEAFSAENYVQERIDKLNEIIIPRFWKGKRLPEFIIREKMGLPPKA